MAISWRDTKFRILVPAERIPTCVLLAVTGSEKKGIIRSFSPLVHEVRRNLSVEKIERQ